LVSMICCACRSLHPSYLHSIPVACADVYVLGNVKRVLISIKIKELLNYRPRGLSQLSRVVEADMAQIYNVLAHVGQPKIFLISISNFTVTSTSSWASALCLLLALPFTCKTSIRVPPFRGDQLWKGYIVVQTASRRS